jgi:simple sugar transport system permease protein
MTVEAVATERSRSRGLAEWGRAALRVPALTLLLAVTGVAIVFWIAGADIPGAFAALAEGAFGSEHAVLETLTRAVPLMLTGASVAFAARARLWNIGAEGQLFAGAIAGYAVVHTVPAPGWMAFPMILLAGFSGGAAYAGLAGILMVRRGVSEVISTVMLNYIAMLVLSLLLLNGPWSDPGSAYEQTAPVPKATEFPLLALHSHLHVGLLVALAACTAIYFVISRTSLGFDIRAFGENPTAYAAKMGNPGRLILVVMAISGGLAGLAGVGEVFGTHHRLLSGISAGYGYTGISLAILVRLNPLGIVLGSILFGGIVSAAIKLQILAGVPSAASALIQALILLAVLVAGTIAGGRRHVG